MPTTSANFYYLYYSCLLILFTTFTTYAHPLSDDEFLTTEDKLVAECPARDQQKMLRHKQDNKCYEANSRGPCGENMILFPHPLTRKYGFCDCFDAKSETEREVGYLNNRNLSHCVPEIRGQIYVPERNRCYSVFDQGPCPDGKWLVLNATFYPVCAKNTCTFSSEGKSSPQPPDSLSPKFFFALSANSKCFQTMSKGYCSESYELRFSANHFIPQCRYTGSAKRKCPQLEPDTEVRKLRCKPGSRYDHLTKCSRSINPR